MTQTRLETMEQALEILAAAEVEGGGEIRGSGRHGLFCASDCQGTDRVAAFPSCRQLCCYRTSNEERHFQSCPTTPGWMSREQLNIGAALEDWVKLGGIYTLIWHPDGKKHHAQVWLKREYAEASEVNPDSALALAMAQAWFNSGKRCTPSSAS